MLRAVPLHPPQRGFKPGFTLKIPCIKRISCHAFNCAWLFGHELLAFADFVVESVGEAGAFALIV